MAAPFMALVPHFASAQDAKQVREAASVDAGLVVHLGATDGKLEADLATEGRMRVHALGSV